VRSPRNFLMDEPLSNLDAKLRESLRVELKHIQKVQNSTTVFVTHDQIEALTMADRIGVLEHGRLLQVGTPEDIYDRPATTFVAQLVGTPRINLLQTERSNGSLHVAQSDLTLPTPAAHVPDRLLIGVRPEDVRIQPNGAFEGHVSLMEPLGVETIVHIRCGSQTLTSTVSGVVTLLIGEVVRFDLFPDHVHYFDLNGQRL
jgi:multiple sugar transport system ATP-binding protein